MQKRAGGTLQRLSLPSEPRKLPIAYLTLHSIDILFVMCFLKQSYQEKAPGLNSFDPSCLESWLADVQREERASGSARPVGGSEQCGDERDGAHGQLEYDYPP